MQFHEAIYSKATMGALILQIHNFSNYVDDIIQMSLLVNYMFQFEADSRSPEAIANF